MVRLLGLRDHLVHLTRPICTLIDPFLDQRNLRAREGILFKGHPKFRIRILEKLDQVAFRRIPRYHTRDAAISASQQMGSPIQSDFSLLLFRSVAGKAMLLENRENIFLKVDSECCGYRSQC